MTFKEWWDGYCRGRSLGEGVEGIAEDAWDAAVSYFLTCDDCRKFGLHHGPDNPEYLEYMCNCSACNGDD